MYEQFLRQIKLLRQWLTRLTDAPLVMPIGKAGTLFSACLTLRAILACWFIGAAASEDLC